MNNLLNIDDLNFLLKTGEFEKPLISIYFPTHASGKEKEENAIRYKNMLRQCEKLLAEKKLPQKQHKTLIEPAQNLLLNTDFWNHQNGSAAIFIWDGQSKIYSVPIKVKEQVVINYHFYLKPLMELFAANDRFYVLALSQNAVELFVATKFSIEPLELTDAPSSMEDIMQYTVPEEFKQSRNLPK